MFGGPWEIVILLLIILLLFGKRLPQAMRSVGQSITSFKQGMNDGQKNGNSEHLESGE